MFCYNISPIVWNELYNPSHVSDVLNISQITDLPLSRCCTWMAQILTSIWISLYSIQSSCMNVHGGSHVLHGTYLEPFCDPDWWWKKGHVRSRQSEVMLHIKAIFTWVDTTKGYVMWLMVTWWQIALYEMPQMFWLLLTLTFKNPKEIPMSIT